MAKKKITERKVPYLLPRKYKMGAAMIKTTSAPPEFIEGQISLEYHGSIAQLGKMDAYTVAANIIAFSDFLGVISKTAYGEKIQLKTEIQGFRNESFDIDFAMQVAGIGYTMFSAGDGFTIKHLFDLMKDSVKVWKHLKGSPPKEIVAHDSHNVQITNHDGQLIYATNSVVNIIADGRAGQAVERFIKNPLESGATSVKIQSASAPDIAEITVEEAGSFIPISFDRQLMETVLQMALLIESPTFKDGNKWRFYDGQSSIYADIVDEEFLKKVDSGEERFGKGDTLIAKVKISQTSSQGGLKMERTIIEVIDHLYKGEQKKLFT